jgi:predicted permease
MNLLSVIASAFVPIGFVVLLGVLAGRVGVMKAEASNMLAVLVLTFCLPAELFNAMATTSLNDLPDWQFFVATAIGLMGMSLVALAAGLLIFKKPANEAGLQTLNAAFPNIAFVGIPVILAVTGKSGMVFAVIAVIISSLLQPPFALTLLASGSPEQQGKTGVLLLVRSIWGSMKLPVVWAPVAGVLFSVAKLHLPVIAESSFAVIGSATNGLALFALGLQLSGQRLRIGGASIFNAVFKNVAQPVAMWALALALGMSGEPMRVLILLGAAPTASLNIMFALKYNVGVDETDATILLSTVLSLITVGVAIAVTA